MADRKKAKDKERESNPEYENFKQVLSVSKVELNKRQTEYERRKKERR